MQKMNEVFFYQLEKAIKSYRRYAQGRFRENNIDITIDQWLVLNALNENDEITQSDLAELVFKDKASMTRLIELLVLKKYIQRTAHDTSRRRFKLTITPKGHEVIGQILPLVKENRKHALKNINLELLKQTESVLKHISENCKSTTKE
jgi:MarR family transcriptional regulator for hemolysin